MELRPCYRIWGADCEDRVRVTVRIRVRDFGGVLTEVTVIYNSIRDRVRARARVRATVQS